MSSQRPAPEEPTPGTPSTARWRQHFYAILATMITMSLGYVDGWTSNALPILQDKSIKTDQSPLTDEEASWIGSLVALGAMLGSLPSTLLSDAVGRKITILLLTIPFLVSWTIIFFAGRTVWLLYTSRMLIGVGMGGACVVTPLYNEEISEISVRGTLGIYQNLMVTVGVLLSYVCGALLTYHTAAVMGCVPPLILIIVFTWAPESPVYLLTKGKDDLAKKALIKLRSPGADVESELAMMKARVLESVSVRGEKRNLLATMKGYMKDIIAAKDMSALFIVFILMICRQTIGINAIVFYTVEIFNLAGAQMSPSTETIIVGVVQVLATCVSACLVDKVGRRPLLLLSSVGAALCHGGLGVYFLVGQNAQLPWLPLLLVACFVVLFAVGFGPVPWLVIAELLPPAHKRWAAGVAGLVNWLAMFCVTRSFGNVVDAWGPAASFLIFAAASVFATFFVYWFLPETAHKTLLDIQADLKSKKVKPEPTFEKYTPYVLHV